MKTDPFPLSLGWLEEITLKGLINPSSSDGKNPAPPNNPMTAHDLVARARMHNPKAPKKKNCDRWMPAVQVLRAKGMSYLSIWQWLKDEGEDVQDDPSTFISAVSKRYRRHLAKISSTDRITG